MSAVVQPQRPQIAVSAAIFRDGKVLLTRRARSPAKGFYSLPGGRVEFGESLHQALNREVDEEIGESLWNRIAARDDVAVLVDDVQSRVAPGISTRGTEDLVESMVSHCICSA